MSLRQEIEDHLKTYDVRPDMVRPLTNALDSLVEREKLQVVCAFIERLIALEPEIGADETSDQAKLYCRLNTVYCDMFYPAMKLTENNLQTL